MHTKSIRVPEEMLAGIKLVEDHEPHRGINCNPQTDSHRA